MKLWIIGIVLLIVVLLIVRKINKSKTISYQGNYERKSFGRKILDACCRHRS